jgi:hypothetical protein
MNVYQRIAISTGLMFIGFIAILAILDFNNIIMVLGFIALIAVISGTVKVMLLSERHKAAKTELEGFRDQMSRERQKIIKAKKSEKYEFYCPLCLLQSNEYADLCPRCKGGALINAEKKEQEKKEIGSKNL